MICKILLLANTVSFQIDLKSKGDIPQTEPDKVLIQALCLLGQWGIGLVMWIGNLNMRWWWGFHEILLKLEIIPFIGNSKYRCVDERVWSDIKFQTLPQINDV